jgi:hypothetical protein
MCCDKEDGVQQNPAIAQVLARDRAAQLRSDGRNARRSSPTRRSRVTEAARRGAGWLLVDLGLRLAAPRNAVHHPMARGHR